MSGSHRVGSGMARDRETAVSPVLRWVWWMVTAHGAEQGSLSSIARYLALGCCTHLPHSGGCAEGQRCRRCESREVPAARTLNQLPDLTRGDAGAGCLLEGSGDDGRSRDRDHALQLLEHHSAVGLYRSDLIAGGEVSMVAQEPADAMKIPHDRCGLDWRLGGVGDHAVHDLSHDAVAVLEPLGVWGGRMESGVVESVACQPAEDGRHEGWLSCR